MAKLVKCSGHPRLYRRGAVYYHRAAVPQDISATYPKREETLSLHTKDRATALRLVREEAVRVDRLFAQHREEQVRLKAATPDLTEQDFWSLGDRFYRALLQEDDDVREDGFWEESEAETFAPRPGYEGYREAQGDFREDLRHYQGRAKPAPHLLDEALMMIGEEALAPKLDNATRRKLGMTFQQAAIRAQDAVLKRLAGEVIETPPEPPKVSPLAPLPLMSVAVTKFIAERVRAGAWKKKNAADYPMWLSQFIAVLGDRPLNGYRKADGQDFKAVLLALPANWNKLPETRGRPIREAAREAQRLGLPPMSVANLNKGLGKVGAFWNWAADNYGEQGAEIGNPVGKLKVREKVKDKDKRNPFKAADLVTMFNAPLYTGCRSPRFALTPGTYRMSNEAKFWVPLLALFTGARLGEICQLRPEDVQEDAGISFLKIQEGEGQSLKAAASHRSVPLHAKLIERGFLDLVADRRSSEDAWVFPELEFDRDGYRSEAVSRFFTRFRRSLPLKTPATAFHSLRHNFKDACRAARIEDKIAEALSGRETGGVGDAYGSGYPLSVLNENLQRIAYPGLDLSGLPTYAQRSGPS